MFVEALKPPVEWGRWTERLQQAVVSPANSLPGATIVNSQNETPKTKNDRPPPAVFSENPEEQLEHELEEDPDNPSKKVDVGSDESMDASDPVSASLPEHREPVPSSGFDEDEGESNS